MADLVEFQDIIFQHKESMELTDLLAFSAESAFFQVKKRRKYLNLFFLFYKLPSDVDIRTKIRSKLEHYG